MPQLLTAVLDLLAPSRCLVCGVRAEPPWCTPCRRAVHLLGASLACGRCGLTGAHTRAHPCWPSPSPVAATTAAFDYRGPVARTVVSAKVHGARAAWPALGEVLATAVERDAPVVHAVTWVPTDRRRRRARGCDHAESLARRVAARLGRPPRALVAVGRAPDQGARPSAVRPSIPSGTYRARQRVDGGRVLLVDDVLTTGATARAVADVLTAAGAASVHLAVLARAGRHDLSGGSAHGTT